MLTSRRCIRQPTLSSLALTLAATGCGITAGIPDPNVRYIAFGDSATNGPADRQYVDFLPDLLGEPENAFANEGRSGETSGEGLVRLRMILAEQRYPEATTLIYWQGGNDLSEFLKDHDPLLLSSPVDPDFSLGEQLASRLDETQANVADAIADARINRLTVFVATYAPLAPGIAECDALPLDVLLPAQAENGNAYIEVLNMRLIQAAAANGAILVNIAALGDEFRASSENYEDCNHLSAQGNQRAALEFSAAITRNTE